MNRATKRPGPASIRSTVRRVLAALALGVPLAGAFAQAPVNTEPSRQALEDAARTGCDGASVVVRRCAATADDAAKKRPADSLTRSRAATKAAFDRRDRRARDAALQGAPVPANTPVGDAQQLGGVTVTGRAVEKAPTVEEVLQRALNPGVEVSPNGTVTHYGIDGARTECIAKCVGPACCTTMRALPNAARESNSIGR